VIADPATLQTLPAQELAAGYAEVVKTGLISGGALWDRLQDGAKPTDPAVIAACAHVKVRIVSQDERDTGLRQILNLGHTVAHAIETATGYAQYRHGEAVGLGLLAELRLSGADELRAQVREMLRSAGLPVRLEGTDVDAVIYATGRDKKRTDAGPVPFVLCSQPGRPTTGQTVDPADLRAAVQELLSS
jgi:shikimate kinase/3-dehydroquinate synthase